MIREKWIDKISILTKPPTEDDFIELLEARIASKERQSLGIAHLIILPNYFNSPRNQSTRTFYVYHI